MKAVIFGKVFVLVIACAATVSAEVKLPTIFGDHMLLQRDKPVPVWGWASAGETVNVTAGQSTASTKAGADGKWLLRLPALKASRTPMDVEVTSATNKIVIHDVLVGDVWIASGQSNMGVALNQASNAEQEVVAANHPDIRLFSVKVAASLKPADDCTGQWAACTPATAKSVSAVGYFFAKEIAETQKVPVGLILDAVGATAVESWMSFDALQSDPDLKKHYGEPFAELLANEASIRKTHDEWLEHGGRAFRDALNQYFRDALKAKREGKPEPQRPKPPSAEPTDMDNIRLSTVLFNGMVAPLMPFSIKGVIWYQGESNGNNTANANLYQKLFTTMITDWRRRWGQGDFPFLFVQLPNYRARRDTPSDSTWAILREAQRLTQAALPATGMAVTIDVGDAQLLHPPNKAPVGHRLALLARHDVYGESIVAASPLYQSHTVSAGKVAITFDHVGEGLKLANQGEVKGFAVAGADKKFVWAQAKIENANSVSVWSDAIKEPATIRYGWADNPEVNLCNSADLPASPFQVSVK